MTSTPGTDAPPKMGYCPYCGVSLRLLRDDGQGGWQVTCGCRNLIVPYSEVIARGGLREAWEVAVGLRSRYTTVAASLR